MGKEVKLEENNKTSLLSSGNKNTTDSVTIEKAGLYSIVRESHGAEQQSRWNKAAASDNKTGRQREAGC